jgi:hypothetical protein
MVNKTLTPGFDRKPLAEDAEKWAQMRLLPASQVVAATSGKTECIVVC